MTSQELTGYINKHIPITFHLGAEVTFYDGQKIEVHAPLESNLNHRNTAFGGSLSAIGILSGWALLFMKLKEKDLNTRLVIQKSAFDFVEPIEADFRATCCVPQPSEWKRFTQTLEKHKKARIKVESTITSLNHIAGNHIGTYVAILQND